MKVGLEYPYFDLEYYLAHPAYLEEALAYIIRNFGDSLNALEGYCRLLLRPEESEHRDRDLNLLCRVLASFEWEQLEVRRLLANHKKGQEEAKSNIILTMAGKQSSRGNENRAQIPLETPPEEVLAELAQCYHFGTKVLLHHMFKIWTSEGICIQTVEAMKEQVVSMKHLLNKIKDYLQARSIAS